MSNSSETDLRYMELALDAADQAARADEVPVGAVLIADDGSLLATAHNAPRLDHDPTGHAEIRCLRKAAQSIGNYRLTGTTLYVTLEPCTMCAGAISHARIQRLVFGAHDPKGGAVINGVKFFDSPTCHHKPEITSGICAEQAAEKLRTFFRARRR